MYVDRRKVQRGELGLYGIIDLDKVDKEYDGLNVQSICQASKCGEGALLPNTWATTTTE